MVQQPGCIDACSVDFLEELPEERFYQSLGARG